MLIITRLLTFVSIILLLGGGVYFSIKLNFPQTKWKKIIRGFKKVENNSISPFKSLMMSLAARIGVGSIAGVALAIYSGGIGTIFWIWITGIICSVNSFCESYLASKYQIRDENGYRGGPFYYIEYGLKKKKLAILYACFIVIAYIVGFMTIQANTIVISVSSYCHLNITIVAIVLVIISYLSISKGLKSIINITSKIVPIIGIGYITLSLIIIIKNIALIPNVFFNIITSAFNLKSITASFIPCLIIGIIRGVFSTEAGLGTSSIATSTTCAENKVEFGLLQIIGIYFTVFIICTSTALIIITSNYQNLIINDINGIELMQYALNYHLGKYGSIVLILAIIFLAYSTIIAGYYYGESSVKYLCKSKKVICLLKILTIIFLYVGSLLKSSYLWEIVDVLVEILAITNMYSLLKMRRQIIFDYKKAM